MAPQSGWKWCGSGKCGARNHTINDKCYKCNCQLPQWTSHTGSRVPGSAQDAARKKKESIWNDKLSAAKKEKDRKAKEQREKDDTALKCLCCGGKGHAKTDCRQADKACNNCGKVGHLSHLCRSKKETELRPAAKVVNDLAEDAFAEEARKRGWVKDANAPAAAEPEPVEATTASLIDRKKERDKAEKEFNAASKKVQDTREAHEKVQELLVSTSDTLTRAELALQLAVASLTPPAAAPATAPGVCAATLKPAIDVEQLMDANGDPTKIANLFVHLGSSFDLEGTDEGDHVVLQNEVTAMTQSFVTQVSNVFPALVAKRDELMKSVEESKAKKRKADAAIVAVPSPAQPSGSLPSNAAPALVNAAAAAEEAVKRALEVAQAAAATARRTAEIEANLAAQQIKAAKDLADAKAEEDRKAALAVTQAQEREAAAKAKKLAEEAKAKEKQEAL